MIGVYFHKDIILRDLTKFKSAIEEMYNTKVEILDEDFIEEHVFGYTFFYNNVRWNVFMFYQKNEFEEFAIKHNKWSVGKEDGYVKSGFRTLGKVFDYIQRPDLKII
jgi:hypothetical protein